MSVKHFKIETVKRRLKKIEESKESTQAQYSKRMYELADDISKLQERCPHTPDYVWHDDWDGWDQHEDLKGHFEYYCTTCKKVFKQNVMKSAHRREWAMLIENMENNPSGR